MLRRLEVLAKRLLPQFAWRKRKGKLPTLLAQHVPVLRVACPSSDKSGRASQIRVCAEGCRKVGVDVGALVRAYRDNLDSADSSAWSEL